MASRFSDEANEYLRQHWREYSSRELAEHLGKLFHITVATQTVTDQLGRLGINRGRYFQAEKSLIGSRLPVGSERIDKGRTVMVKVGQPNVWKPKAVVVMEHDPRKEQVIFLDGNSLNVTKENMVVVPRRIHARIAKNGWLNSSSEVILAGIKWSELLYALKELDG